MEHRMRITVVRRGWYPDLAGQYLENPAVGPCGLVKEGDSFLVDEEGFATLRKDPKFCPAAWACLKEKVERGFRGEPLYRRDWSRDERKLLVSCDDGARPVTFLLERLDGDVE